MADMQFLLNDIRNDLINRADETVKKKSQRFFKGQLKSYGLRNPDVHALAKYYYKLMDSPSKEEVFELCELLWRSGYAEEALMACDLSFYVKKQYTPSDFSIFQSWIDKYVNNWASCDTFCNHTVGTLLQKFPEYLSDLKKWTQSDNRWMRRAAAVSLIVPARKGKFFDQILEIATLLLLDTDYLVQKGYGWMLKEASKEHAQQVFEFVMANKAKMPRTALRYAIEKMPKSLKEQAMEK
jgi:3-methyladenine DNA glycosylase AlkD